MGKAVIDGEPAIIENDTINENEVLKKKQNTEKQNDSIKSKITQLFEV